MILIGPISKTDSISGQSLSFQNLINSFNSDKISFNIIDINFGNTNFLFKIINYFKVYLKFLKLLNKKSTKVVYLTISQSFYGFFRDLFFIWICYFYKIGIVAHLHGGNFQEFYLQQNVLIKKIIEITYSKLKSIIVLSSEFSELFNFLKDYKQKIKVVPNGIENENIGKKNKYDPKKPVILYLSNLIESKGYLDVLKSAEILKSQFSIMPKVIFCGNFISCDDDISGHNVNEAKNYFFNYINENNLNENIIFMGLITGLLKNKLLKEADIVILPSNYISEGQPISLIEGLANKCALITTNYRDIKNINLNNITGLHVPYNNPYKIASAISSISIEKMLDFQENAYKHFLENYTFEKHYRLIKMILFGND